MDTIFSILTAVLAEATNPTTAGLAIAVIGLNIHFGFTGLINFGQAGFMLLGAYGFAISVREGLPLGVGILIGLALAVVFALILGIPTLQLRGDYLAIVTISAAEIIRFLGRLSIWEELTGGALGIRADNYAPSIINLSPFSRDPADRFTLLPLSYRDVADGALWVRVVGILVFIALIAAIVVVYRNARKASAAGEDGEPLEPGKARVGRSTVLLMSGLAFLAFLALFFAVPLTYPQTGINGWWARTIAWMLVGLSSLLLFLLVRSPWGRLLRGIREDEDAIRSLGKNVFAIKMQALIIGGMFGALGGIVFVMASTVQPDSLGRQTTFLVFTALLLGGLATVFGPVLGSIIFFSVRILIRELGATYVPDSIMNNQESNQFAFMVVGIALMLLVIFRPQGILGNKKEVSLHV